MATTAQTLFRSFRTPGEGEKLIFDDKLFVEGVPPGAIVRKLSADEMAACRAPFVTREPRRPTWRFPNELPIAGELADVYTAMEKAHEALAAAYPKLLFAGDPGIVGSVEIRTDMSHFARQGRLVFRTRRA